MLVGFIADEDEIQAGWPVRLSFFQPFGHMIEALLVGNIVADDGSDRVSIIAPRDGLEALLAGLDKPECTVSQICSLMLLRPIVIVLAPN